MSDLEFYHAKIKETYELFNSYLPILDEMGEPFLTSAYRFIYRDHISVWNIATGRVPDDGLNPLERAVLGSVKTLPGTTPTQAEKEAAKLAEFRAATKQEQIKMLLAAMASHQQ